MSTGHGPTVAPLISNNSFSGSAIESISITVGYMNLSGSTDTLTFSPTILNNTITFGAAGAFDGIELEATDYLNYLVGDHLNLTVAGNTITGALDGIDTNIWDINDDPAKAVVEYSGYL